MNNKTCAQRPDFLKSFRCLHHRPGSSAERVLAVWLSVLYCILLHMASASTSLGHSPLDAGDVLSEEQFVEVYLPEPSHDWAGYAQCALCAEMRKISRVTSLTASRACRGSGKS
jgi:hypothetical protein